MNKPYYCLNYLEVLRFARDSADRTQTLNAFGSLHERHGDVVKFPWPINITLILHPRDVKYVLQDNASNYIKGQVNQKLNEVIGDNLFATEGEKWERSRKSINRFFNASSIDAYKDIIFQSTKKFTDELKLGQTKEFDFDLFSSNITIHIINQCLFGGKLTPENMQFFGEAIHFLLPEIVKSFRSPLKRIFGPILPSTHIGKRYVSEMNQLLEQIMRADQIEMAQALREGGVSPEGVRSEMITLIMAGHETTAKLLSWAIYHLHNSPDYREKLTLDLRQKSEAKSKTDKYLESEVLDLFIREVLRLHPSAPSVVKMALSSDQINGTPIKPGEMIGIHPYLCQRDPRFWHDPLTFKPERFKEAVIDPFSYFPFSRGARKCIGDRFAIVEMKIVLGYLIEHMDIKLASHYRYTPEFNITLKNQTGTPVEVEFL